MLTRDASRMLRWIPVAFALASALCAPLAAAACELPNTGEVHLETRKPVLGEDVRLVTGFGMRIHPLLGVRRMHTGVDWAASRDTPIFAAGAGRVVSAGTEGEYGNIVVIDHGGGEETAYAHLGSFDVREGDCLAAGARIGGAGSTGLSTATGVHFEVRHDGKPVDPMRVKIGR